MVKFSFVKNILKRFAKRLWLNCTLNWSLGYITYSNIPNIYMFWEIVNFVIKSESIFLGDFLNEIIVLPWQLL
jgi:hypothetical protein